MGIRFFCPNGHKLNVKEHQAGQRGICPKCGVKLLIPMESTRPSGKESRERNGAASDADDFLDPSRNESRAGGTYSGGDPAASDIIDQAHVVRTNAPVINFQGPVRHDPLETDDLPHVTIPHEEEEKKPESLVEASASGSPQRSDPFEDPSAIWYVKPPEGGQYGPAESDIMKQWIAERRIHPASDVWREGWAEWESASDVFPELLTLFSEEEKASGNATSASREVDGTDFGTEDADDSSVHVASAGKNPAARLHRKPTAQEARVKTITTVIILTLAIVVLGGALIYVLTRQ